MSTTPLIIPLFGYETLAEKLQGKLGKAKIHQFPDGESLIQIDTPIEGAEVIFVCSLDQPNTKALPLFFAAKTARDLGASRIGLIAPYLAYMRQDKVFHPGEGITSRYFASLISEHFDWMQTVDPHLHRWHELSEIYKIPAQALHATRPIAEWISEHVDNPLLIGPDEESKQWVAEIATLAHCPYVVSTKIRESDSQVRVSLPEMTAYQDHQPVLVDDIISTGRTMMDAVKGLIGMGMKAPICIGVHALFVGDAYESLVSSGVSSVVTCNTVNHFSNAIDLSGLFG